MACEVGEAYFEDMPDVNDIESQLDNTTKVNQPITGQAAAARGPWILDSGASELVVGKTNITKR
eukprot:6670813-Heterocapsa_arctica.AAC.1